MKTEALKTGEKILDWAKHYSLKLLFIKSMYFIAGILVSRGVIFGSYYPFGLSFSAAVPGKIITPTILGTLFGYLMNLKITAAVRYISTVISITAIRWTLSDLTKIKNHFLYAPAIVFFSSLITGLAVNCAQGFYGRDIYISFIESVVAAGAAMFFDKSFKILSKKQIYELNAKEFTCIAVGASMILLSLSEISFGGVSIGHILAIVMILISALIMNVTGGAVTGIASGVIFSLPAFGFTYISGMYAFSGMLSGFFSSFGRLAVSCAFLFSSALISFQSGDTTKMIIGLYESIFATIIFLSLPKSVFSKIKGSSPSFLQDVKNDNIKEALTQKLRFASRFLVFMPKLIDKTSCEFSKVPEIDFKSTCISSAYSVCNSCGLCTYCWSKESESTHKNFSNVINLVATKKEINTNDFSPEFLKRCRKTDVLSKKIVKAYEDFCAQKVAKAKMSEMQRVMSEQIGGIGAIIEELSSEISENFVFDCVLSEKIKSELLRAGIDTVSVICNKNENNKLFIDIECSYILKDKFTSHIVKRLSSICGRKLCEPIIGMFGDICKIQFCEPKVFKVDFGFSQHACNNGKYCGDSCCKFEDGTGCLNVIISDGMGTGGAAAAQGAMTSKLMQNFVKSGMSFKSSAKFINSALLLRPGEESLSTLDALSINLFSGKAKCMKAGSPFTLIVRDEKIIKINFESLPIGILSDVPFSCQDFDLQDGDSVIMLSDGATDIGEEWIMKLIESEKHIPASQLSKKIVNKAVWLRKSMHDDDITAVVLNITKIND